MNTVVNRLAVAAALVFAAAAAHAESPTIANEDFQPAKSRAEVRAEVDQAARAGTLIAAGEIIAAPMDAQPSQVARDTTRMEAASANAVIASLYLAG